jgi:hypothetical protein
MNAVAQQSSALGKPACYFPLCNGEYDVGPGLKRFGHDFGNSQADQQVFQFDNHFFEYRQVKLDARRERLSKYYRTHMLPADVLVTVARFIIERLTLEQPDFFSLQSRNEDEIFLDCALTGEVLVFDRKMHFLRCEGGNGSCPRPDYHDAIDALTCQTQEDIAIVCQSAFGRDWLGAIHLCMANHWSAEEKIGLPFQQVHKPVAGMRNETRDAEAIIDAIINKGPFVRFAWGLSTDDRLNHHPRAGVNSPDRYSPVQRFDPHAPSLFMRVERQTLWPFPEQRASLFTIRTYLTDCREFRRDSEYNSQLIACINSMTEEQLQYKRLLRDKDSILTWLERGKCNASSSRELSHAIKQILNA